MECAEIGANIFAKNGSAVDAAIAALLCEGIASLHRYFFSYNFLFLTFVWRKALFTLIKIGQKLSMFLHLIKAQDWAADF